jgi:hypothetical protein
MRVGSVPRWSTASSRLRYAAFGMNLKAQRHRPLCLLAVLVSLSTRPAICLDELLPNNWKRDKDLTDAA